LASRIWATMERDYGVHVAADFGQAWNKMTDDELRAWGRLGMAAKPSNLCSECGQELPEE
jgi:hypothetical protein